MIIAKMAYGFERRYWLSSADFYELYQQGLLDDGEHAEDFAMWAGFHQIKLDREIALQKLSQERLQRLCTQDDRPHPRYHECPVVARRLPCE